MLRVYGRRWAAPRPQSPIEDAGLLRPKRKHSPRRAGDPSFVPSICLGRPRAGTLASTALFPHESRHASAAELPTPRERSPLAPTGIDAFERPVADHAGEPAAILLAREDEAADRQLAALMVAVEQVDGQDLTR